MIGGYVLTSLFLDLHVYCRLGFCCLCLCLLLLLLFLCMYARLGRLENRLIDHELDHGLYLAILDQLNSNARSSMGLGPARRRSGALCSVQQIAVFNVISELILSVAV